MADRSKHLRYAERTMENNYWRSRRHLTRGLVALALILLAGALWYKYVEGWTWIDAIYMSVITLTTVGFGEINPLTARGRLFTMVFLLSGVGVIAYILNNFTESIVQGYLQAGLRLHKRRKYMESLTGHYIICGFGRTGRQIAIEFAAEKVPFIIVDSDDASLQLAQSFDYLTFQGDATEDQVLLQVGIERARCLVAALPSDAENLYTVLSAKTLAPTIRTIARASSEEAIQKMERGGADVVVSPYISGGKRMAAAALRPQVVDFIDGILTGSDRTVYVEEFLLTPTTCPIIGCSLGEAQLGKKSGALILAIRRADNHLIIGPSADTLLCPGDLVISMGATEQLRRLSHILSPLKA